ncbi:MAG: hypothetical protein ACK4UX_02920 [Thiobacillus sp.]
MNRLALPLLFLLGLASAAPCWAEPSRGGKSKPLNLSLPRDFLQAPPGPDTNDQVRRNLEAPATQVPPPLPYGSGYESRHANGGSAGGAPFAGAGAGAMQAAPGGPGAGAGRSRR